MNPISSSSSSSSSRAPETSQVSSNRPLKRQKIEEAVSTSVQDVLSPDNFDFLESPPSSSLQSRVTTGTSDAQAQAASSSAEHLPLDVFRKVDFGNLTPPVSTLPPLQHPSSSSVQSTDIPEQKTNNSSDIDRRNLVLSSSSTDKTVELDNDSRHWIFPNPPGYKLLENADHRNYSAFHRMEKIRFKGEMRMRENEWKDIQQYLPEQLKNLKGRNILNRIIQLYLHVNFRSFPHDQSCFRDLDKETQKWLRNLVLVHAPRFFDRFVGFFQVDYNSLLFLNDRYAHFRLNTPSFNGVSLLQYQKAQKIWPNCPEADYLNACIARVLAWPNSKIKESNFCIRPASLNQYLNKLMREHPQNFLRLIEVIYKLLQDDENLLYSASLYLL